MKHRLGLSLSLLLCAAAQAADPPVMPQPARSAATKPAAKPLLKLGIGDVRRYLKPDDYAAAVSAPDADSTAVVVEGTRTLSALQSLRPVPQGLGSLVYLVSHPTQSWRIFLPDVNAPALGPTYDKVPPPIFRWGP
jgi:hypothetical protein